ncbi:hypothetical protein TNCV_1631961 [Trichonephila clavipes]|nr:hypothetical protein TNCV_1631961 [Trichonephila clavipes]
MTYIQNNRLELVAPPTPTRFGHGASSILDIVLMESIFYTCNILSIPELSSDHDPFKIAFLASTKCSLPPPQTYTNWNICKNEVINSENYDITTANSPHDIDAKIHDITLNNFYSLIN